LTLPVPAVAMTAAVVELLAILKRAVAARKAIVAVAGPSLLNAGAVARAIARAMDLIAVMARKPLCARARSKSFIAGAMAIARRAPRRRALHAPVCARRALPFALTHALAVVIAALVARPVTGTLLIDALRRAATTITGLTAKGKGTDTLALVAHSVPRALRPALSTAGAFWELTIVICGPAVRAFTDATDTASAVAVAIFWTDGSVAVCALPLVDARAVTSWVARAVAVAVARAEFFLALVSLVACLADTRRCRWDRRVGERSVAASTMPVARGLPRALRELARGSSPGRLAGARP